MMDVIRLHEVGGSSILNYALLEYLVNGLAYLHLFLSRLQSWFRMISTQNWKGGEVSQEFKEDVTVETIQHGSPLDQASGRRGLCSRSILQGKLESITILGKFLRI